MKDKYTIQHIADEDEALLLRVSLYKKLIGETLQLVETLGLPQGQEKAIKTFIKKNFYLYLNEYSEILDIEEVSKKINSRELKTVRPIYNE